MQKIGSTKSKFQGATAEISYFDSYCLDFLDKPLKFWAAPKLRSGLEISFQLLA